MKKISKKKVSRKWIFFIITFLIIGIIVLIIYSLKPWIPAMYRDPLYCDDNIECRNYNGNCVNEYHGSDEWIVLGGPGCKCNLTENRCIVVPYSPPKFNYEISYSCSSDDECTLVETDECNNGNPYDEVCINSSSVKIWDELLDRYRKAIQIVCPEIWLNSNFSCKCTYKKCSTYYTNLAYNVTRAYTLIEINQSEYKLLKRFEIR